MQKKPKVASLAAVILDSALFVVDPIMGLLFCIVDLFKDRGLRKLIDEETKSDRSLM